MAGIHAHLCAVCPLSCTEGERAVRYVSVYCIVINNGGRSNGSSRSTAVITSGVVVGTMPLSWSLRVLSVFVVRPSNETPRCGRAMFFLLAHANKVTSFLLPSFFFLLQVILSLGLAMPAAACPAADLGVSSLHPADPITALVRQLRLAESTSSPPS